MNKEQQAMMDELARLKAENEDLKKKEASRSIIGFKVSEKGACSVYGLGKFPVTLYVGQWERLFGKLDELKAYLKANESKLSRDKTAKTTELPAVQNA